MEYAYVLCNECKSYSCTDRTNFIAPNEVVLGCNSTHKSTWKELGCRKVLITGKIR